MSKKAAKKATKARPNPKGKGAPKDGPKTSAKDRTKAKPELGEPGSAPVPKDAKRRVTVSVKATETSAAADAGETAAAATHGETTGHAQPALGRPSRSKTPKRAPRIIAVPSDKTNETPPDDATARQFANSPFAVAPSESNDAPSDREPSTAASKNKKTSAPRADKATKSERGETRSRAKSVSSKVEAVARTEDAETPASETSASETSASETPRSKAKPDAEPKSKADGTRAERKPTKASGPKHDSKAAVDGSKKGSQRKDKRGGSANAASLDDGARHDAATKTTKARAKRSIADAGARDDVENVAEPSLSAETETAEPKKSGKSKTKRRDAQDPSVTVDSPPDAEDDPGKGVSEPAPGTSESDVEGASETTDDDDDDDDDESLLQVGADAADDAEEELSEEEENRRYLKGLLEALLFASDKPLSGRELARAARIDKKRTLQLLTELRKEYRYRGVNLVEVSGGFVLRSNPTYGAFVQKALALRPVKLSRAQLETLAIIAYRQPITRPEIDDIRGVDSGQVLKGLADRDLIKMLGKKDEAGRPMLYGTTQTFLELFSLDSLKGLPNLREFTELSEDSREKFAAVTGETITGPTELTDETPEANAEQTDAEGSDLDVESDADDEGATAAGEGAGPDGETDNAGSAGNADDGEDEPQPYDAPDRDEESEVSQSRDEPFEFDVSGEGVHVVADDDGFSDDASDAEDADAAGDVAEDDVAEDEADVSGDVAEDDVAEDDSDAWDADSEAEPDDDELR